jgi:hypothetical protein
MRLHLGCSDDFKSNYVNVDCAAPPAGSGRIYDDGVDTGMYRTAGGFIYQHADLNSPWPWKDGSVDEIIANDVFEHLANLHWGYLPFDLSSNQDEEIGRVQTLLLKVPELTTMRRVCLDIPGKIWAMNEAHRVLKAGGILNFTVPSACLSDGRLNVGAFADPTHRTFWTLDDCFYFGEQWNNFNDPPEKQHERARFGEAYGITALFRFPPMVDCGAKGWKVADYRGSVERLMWRLEEANGRAKIRARIEAIK